jgi:hypothetical protein
MERLPSTYLGVRDSVSFAVPCPLQQRHIDIANKSIDLLHLHNHKKHILFCFGRRHNNHIDLIKIELRKAYSFFRGRKAY